MLIRCDKCNGIKTILGLGGMQKECDACHGIGQIENKISVTDLKNLNDEHVPARKRGRKPKIQQDILQAGA